MTAKGRTLPRGTSWDDRAWVLAKRLIPDLPPRLDPPKSQHSWMALWAAIGMELAEKEPEFGWGPGRHEGSVNKKLAETKDPQVRYKRQYREKKRREMLAKSEGD
jgi:hypothetical protein